MAPQILTTNGQKIYHVKSLVYGHSGVGKTRLAITCPDTMIFSAEDGLLSLRKEKINFIETKNFKQLNDAFKWLTSAEARLYNHILLDSLSEVAEVILAEEKSKRNDARAAYGAMQDSVYELVRYLRDFKGKHITTLGKQLVVESGLAKKCVPIIPSEKLQAQIPYFWDCVLHMYSDINPANGASYTAFHTKDHANWTAKDRSGALDQIEEPHLGKMFAKILAA